MLHRVFGDKHDRDLRKKSLFVMHKKVRAGFEYQPIKTGQECFVRRQEIIEPTVGIRHSVGDPLPARGMGLSLKHHRNAGTWLARCCIVVIALIFPVTYSA
jgi:hypothetical protein